MRDHALTVTDVDDRDDRWRFTVTLLAEERFGLVFEILDRAYLTRMRRERGCGVKPWRTHSRLLVSHNLLTDPAYAGQVLIFLSNLRTVPRARLSC